LTDGERCDIHRTAYRVVALAPKTRCTRCRVVIKPGDWVSIHSTSTRMQHACCSVPEPKRKTGPGLFDA
jgi:hypothetical protein